MKIGAILAENGVCEFRVWSPLVKSMSLKITFPEERIVPMEKDDNDYWTITLDNTIAGTKYYFQLNTETNRPDPASHYQPDGVHKESEVVNHHSFVWEDEHWKGISMKELIIYELHVGTITPDGTFTSIIEKLDYFNDLGITAIEIMPVSQFPGVRNWGYDGVYPYAPQNSYGGPQGMKELINACHKKNIAVILDVVYNHFGPEGNYTREYGPYFTSKYKTPWGDALNFDDEYSDHVRNYFLENAIYWLENYHIDGFRLDAVDKIYDLSAKHFLRELAEVVGEYALNDDKLHFIIAESDLNDVKIINPISENGYGLNAQWSDDFHHALHSLLTNEKEGYYSDFGTTKHLVNAIKNSFVYSGKYSKYRKRKHGNIAVERPPYQFVVCTQNHDQIGNRAFGERLAALVNFESVKLAAGFLLLSPYIPLIFMGEEYGEKADYKYFISHGDSSLIESVRHGRKEEFSAFNWSEEIPDPYEEQTFYSSKLNWSSIENEEHNAILKLYKTLIYLRKNIPSLANPERENIEVYEAENKVIIMRRWFTNDEILVIYNLNDEAVTFNCDIPSGKWQKMLDSASTEFLGPGESTSNYLTGAPQNITIKKQSFSIYHKERI